MIMTRERITPTGRYADPSSMTALDLVALHHVCGYLRGKASRGFCLSYVLLLSQVATTVRW